MIIDQFPIKIGNQTEKYLINKIIQVNLKHYGGFRFDIFWRNYKYN